MELIWSIFNNDGEAIAGVSANTSLIIRRGADGYLYDWSDSTFKAAAWTTNAIAMTEIDAVNLAGHYARSVDESGWNDGWYHLFTNYNVYPKAAGGAEFLIEAGKIIEEHVATDLDASVSSRLAASAYVAPDNSGIAAIDGRLPSDPADASNIALAFMATQETITTRLAAADYVAPDNAGIGTLEGRLTADRAGYLDNLSTGAVALEGTAQSILAEMQSHPTLGEIEASTVLAKVSDLGNLDVAVSSRLAAADYISPDNATIAAIDARLPADPADESAIEAAIAGISSISLAEIEGSAVLAKVSDLGNLDAAVSSRLADADYEAPDNAGIAAIQSDVAFLADVEGGRWKLDATNQMILYKADNVTEIARFDLFDGLGDPAFRNVFERRRV
jgi:hypothetical protein